MPERSFEPCSNSLFASINNVGLGACITQTIISHATARGIHLDDITIDLEGNIDLRGFTGISSEVRPGAQEFKVKVNIKSSSASKEQVAEIYEIGKRLSPAFDTLTKLRETHLSDCCKYFLI